MQTPVPYPDQDKALRRWPLRCRRAGISAGATHHDYHAESARKPKHIFVSHDRLGPPRGSNHEGESSESGRG